MLQTNPLLLDDFSGGITDNFIDAPINKYAVANNFVVTENRKLAPIDGSQIYDADKPQIPLGNNRIGDLIYLNDDLLVQANTKLYRENGTFWTELIGPTGNAPFNAGDANSSVSKAFWNNHLLISNDEYSPTMKVFKDDTDTLQLRSAGLPSLPSTPNLAGTAGANSYLYEFHFFYEYKVGTVTFQDNGPTTLAQIQNIDAPDSNQITITGIPTLSNAGGYNWEVSNVKIKIFRSENGGQVLYNVGEVTNGTTTFNDTISDTSLIGNALIYTSGGVLDNGEPPLAKALHVANGAAWYGNVKLGTEIIKNRVYQSIIDDPDSVPSTNFTDLDDDIVGISSYLDRVIVLCKDSVYRLDGTFDEQGGGLVTYQLISDTHGCVSQSSIVRTQNGVVFASMEGFVYTDGFDTFKISDGFNSRYKALVRTDIQRKRIYGAFDNVEGKVWWSVQTSENAADDVDTSYILDVRYGMRPDSTFTTAGGQDEFAPTCINFQKTNMLRGDKRGYLFHHSPDFPHSHPKIDLTKVPADWFVSAILYDFITVATSFGDSKHRKFNNRIIIQCDNISNLSLQPVSITDIGTRERELTAIRWRGNFIWGDPLFSWGADEFVWGTPGYIEQMRRFAGDDQRCTYRQIQLKNDFATITESNSFDTATVNAAAKTVTLDNVADNDWPEEMGGYFIYFADDGYQTGFEIDIEGTDTLTVKDDGGRLVDGSGKQWVIRGFPKNEVLKLLNLTILYSLLGQQQLDYASGSLGGNE